MRKLLEIRSEIDEHFQNCITCSSYFVKEENDDAFAIYYTAKYLIQDTGEALLEHRERDFSHSPLLAYIELWGVLQACIIQQDCIDQIYQLFTGNRQLPQMGPKSRELRDLRVRLAGHPVAAFETRSGAKQKARESRERSFLGRDFGNYSQITFETYLPDRIAGIAPNARPLEKKLEKMDHPRVSLGVLIDEYAGEAAARLLAARKALEAHRFV